MLTATARPCTCTGRQALGCGATGGGLAGEVGLAAGVGTGTGGGVGAGTGLGVGNTDAGALAVRVEFVLEPPPPRFSSPTTTTISNRPINGGYTLRRLRDPGLTR